MDKPIVEVCLADLHSFAGLKNDTNSEHTAACCGPSPSFP